MRKKNLILLIKPTHDCNLNCEYCYDKIEKQFIKNKIISLDTVKDIIEKTCRGYENISLIWHGGESLLAGEDFFYKAHDIIKEISEKYDTKIETFMQTNGILYEKNKRMLNNLNIKASTSLDYTNENKYRSSKEMFEYIKKVSEENKISPINVISSYDSENLINVYEYIKNKKINISFNKIFLNKETDEEIEIFAKNYNKYIEYVLFDKNATFLERSFDNILSLILGTTDDVVCSNKDCLTKFLSINPDGDIFICDRFGISNSKNYGFINIKDINFTILEFWETEIFKKIQNDNQEFKNKFCSKCRINFICKGNCKSNRIDEDKNINLKINNKSDCIFKEITYMYLLDRLYYLTEEEMLKLNPLVFKKLFQHNFINKYILK